MAADKVVFNVLDVGQGLSNFIEVFNGTTLIHTLLIDLGSTKSKTDAGGASVKFITVELKKMTKPTIDVLCLTHKDSDHVNLVDDLLANFAIGSLSVGAVRYGGKYEWYTKASGNVLNTLKGYCSASEIKGFTALETNFNGSTRQWVPFWSQDGVSLSLLVANAPVTSADTGMSAAKRAKVEDKPDGHNVNTKSLVLIVGFAGANFVVTGDATAQTVSACVDVLAKPGADLKPVLMVTLPHHGSKKTLFDLASSRSPIDDDALEVVNDFIDKLSARTVSVSAFEKHSHPSITVIDLFLAKARTDRIYYSDTSIGGGLHAITAFIDKTLSASGVTPAFPSSFGYFYYSYFNPQNVYATLCYDRWYWGDFSYAPLKQPLGVTGLGVLSPTSPPPIGARWTFTLPTGTGAPADRMVVDAVPNRPSTLAQAAPAIPPAPPRALPEAAPPPAHPPAVLPRLKVFA